MNRKKTEGHCDRNSLLSLCCNLWGLGHINTDVADRSILSAYQGKKGELQSPKKLFKMAIAIELAIFNQLINLTIFRPIAR